MRADDFHNGTMYAAFMLPCCLGRGSDRSSQFGMEEFATATGGLLSPLFAHQSESVSLCVIMWRWRDVEKIQLSQRVTMDRREGAQRSPVRGSVRGSVRGGDEGKGLALSYYHFLQGHVLRPLEKKMPFSSATALHNNNNNNSNK